MSRTVRSVLVFIVPLVILGWIDLLWAWEVLWLVVGLCVPIAFIRSVARPRAGDRRIDLIVVGMFATFLSVCLVIAILVTSASSISAMTNVMGHSMLVQLTKALQLYHNDHNCMPPVASVDKQGKPLLSWRVHLLPYLNENALYRKFHLDEPWDSPHNIKLLPEMPVTFRLPPFGRKLTVGFTVYQLIVGPGAFFEHGQQRSLGRLFVADGLETIILGVAHDPVPWTKPADIAFDQSQPLVAGTFMEPTLGLLGIEVRDDFYFATASSSCMRVRRTVNQAKLRACITWTGDENVRWEDLKE